MKTNSTVKIMTVVLAICLLFSSMPFTVFAEGNEPKINAAEFYYDLHDLKYGTSPKTVTGMWRDDVNYSVAYECWSEIEQNADGQ